MALGVDCRCGRYPNGHSVLHERKEAGGRRRKNISSSRCGSVDARGKPSSLANGSSAAGAADDVDSKRWVQSTGRSPMKRYAILALTCAVFVAGAIVQAQSRTSNPQTAQDLEQQRQRLYEAVQALQGQPLYQRGGAGGRGAPLNQPTRMNGTGTAWWTNPAMIARLGLTDDQKARIERSFENHRSRLQSNT